MRRSENNLRHIFLEMRPSFIPGADAMQGSFAMKNLNDSVNMIRQVAK